MKTRRHKTTRKEILTENMRKGEVENLNEKSAKTTENREDDQWDRAQQLLIKSKGCKNRIPREEISMNKRKDIINRIPHKK